MKKKISAVAALAMIYAVPMPAHAQSPSAVACDRYADQYAQQASAQGQMLGGAAAGSLIGLGIGSIFAASGVGAAIGATVGLVGGGAKRQERYIRLYDAAYRDCLAGIRR